MSCTYISKCDYCVKHGEECRLATDANGCRQCKANKSRCLFNQEPFADASRDKVAPSQTSRTSKKAPPKSKAIILNSDEEAEAEVEARLPKRSHRSLSASATDPEESTMLESDADTALDSGSRDPQTFFLPMPHAEDRRPLDETERQLRLADCK